MFKSRTEYLMDEIIFSYLRIQSNYHQNTSIFHNILLYITIFEELYN